ncbi:hypothetical protein EJB05_25548, partial [Eragrostis curvula]
MGCVISSDGDDHRRRIIGVSHQHHIVSLTSSTYGILTAPRAYSSAADIQSSPPPPPPPEPSPEVINSWELMAGLVDPSTPAAKKNYSKGMEAQRRIPLRPIDGNSSSSSAVKQIRQRPPAEAVLYTTSLRGVRATFEACNAVRAALQAHGVAFRERDVSMDRGFRDELRGLLLAVEEGKQVLPRLFVRGRLVDEVLRLDEEGALAPLLDGLPKARGGNYSCDGCGGMRFLPCFDCSGSRKMAVPLPKDHHGRCSRRKSLVVVRCRECNENGLVLCPICS